MHYNEFGQSVLQITANVWQAHPLRPGWAQSLLPLSDHMPLVKAYGQTGSHHFDRSSSREGQSCDVDGCLARAAGSPYCVYGYRNVGIAQFRILLDALLLKTLSCFSLGGLCTLIFIGVKQLTAWPRH